jgi:ribosomal protein S7
MVLNDQKMCNINILDVFSKDRLNTIYKNINLYILLNQLPRDQRLVYKDYIKNHSQKVLKYSNDLQQHHQHIVTLKKNVEKIRRGRNIIQIEKDYTEDEILEQYDLNIQLSNINYYSLEANALFIRKFSNFLMKHGEKRKSLKIILNFLEILRRDFHILDPLDILRKFIFLNLVPVIQPKSLGTKTKRMMGINLPIYKRISMSFKLFIKGARSHNVPIVQGLLIEFFNFYKETTLLQKTNINMLEEIKKNSLYKYLQPGQDMLTPEEFYFLDDEGLDLTKEKNKTDKFDIIDLYEIEWESFDLIIRGLGEENYKHKLQCQYEVLFYFKLYIIKFIMLNKELKTNEYNDFILSFFNKNDSTDDSTVDIKKNKNIKMTNLIKKDENYITNLLEKDPVKIKETEFDLSYVFYDKLFVDKVARTIVDVYEQYNKNFELIKLKEKDFLKEFEKLMKIEYRIKLNCEYISSEFLKNEEIYKNLLKQNKLDFNPFKKNENENENKEEVQIETNYLEFPEEVEKLFTYEDKINTYTIYKNLLKSYLSKNLQSKLTETDYINLFNNKNNDQLDLDLSKSQFQDFFLINKVFDSYNIMDQNLFNSN